MRILHVVGARPNIVKVAAVHAGCREAGLAQVVVHTGQHYDANMSAVFLDQLGLPAPDVDLGVGSGTHAEQTARVMTRLEPVLLERDPDWVIVYGDVNSTVAAALVAAKLPIPVAHVEAGLRSFDRTMPEEVNRVLTDQLSDLLFTTGEDGDANLAHEGVAAARVRRVGNVMIDTLVRFARLAEAMVLPSHPKEYGLVTLHRPSNVDDPESLRRIMGSLARISARLPIVFPVHPRTRRILDRLVDVPEAPRLWLVEPLGYLEFLNLESKARVVITDSGGIQEETTFLGIPCLTLRPNTERPITVTLGTNKLSSPDALESDVDAVLDGRARKGVVPPLWDGHAAERIAAVMAAL
jgi:UDP-N-acetylglucosamine 2-epimerase (non-hydrolysing)